MDTLLIEVSPSKWLLRCWINSLPSSVASSLVTMDTQVGPLSCVSSRGQLSRGMELWGAWFTTGRQQVAEPWLESDNFEARIEIRFNKWKALEKKAYALSLSLTPHAFPSAPATLQSVLALYWKGVACAREADRLQFSPSVLTASSEEDLLSISMCRGSRILEARPLTNKCSDVLSWLKPGKWKSQVFEVWCLIALQLQKNWKKSIRVLTWGKTKLPIPFSKLPSLRHNQSITRVSNTAELDYIAGILATSHPWTPLKLYRKSCIREALKDDTTLQTGD